MSTLSYRATNGDGGNTTFSIDTFSEDEIKVYVNEVLKTKGSSNDYVISNYTATGGRIDWVGSAPTSSDRIRIVRQTKILNNGGNAVEGKATYSAGAAVKATDLNNNTKQALRSLQEHNDQLIQTYDIEPDGITNALIADDQIDSEHYVDGSIDHQHLSNDCIDGDNIQDDVINSEHYAPLSIDSEHIANSAVTSTKIADNAVTTTEILNGAVTRAKLEADIIDGTKLADNAVDSEHYTDGSIDRVHLEADIIDSTKLADNAVDSEHYVDGSIDREHLEADIIDSTKLADNAVGNEHLQNDSVRTAEIQNDAVTIDKIADAAIVTNSEQASHSVNDTTFFTTAAAEARYFNASTGETIKDGQTFPDNDTTIATTAAINDRIIDLVDDVGGFVPIANETSFPTANPDVNNGAGTIVSVSAASTDLVPSGTTVTIANGRGSGLPVVITGVSATIPSGFGFLVETTTTDHTYAFHRLVPKATEVTTVAANATQVQTVHNNITQVQTVHNNITDIVAVANDASDIGAVAAKATQIGLLGTADAIADMNTLGTADVVADLNTLGTADVVADMNMLATSDVVADMALLATTDVISDMNDLATSANITAMSNCSGSIANINTAASNLTNINNFANVYRIGSQNPQTSLDVGDLFFNTQSNSLKVYTGSAWVDGVTQTGNFALKTGNTFTGSNIYNDNVKAIFGTSSDGLEIFNNGNHSRLVDNGTGNIEIASDSGINLFNGDFSETIATFTPNGAITLYHDNTKRIETTASGTTVTGGSLVLESTFPTFTLKDIDHNPDWTLYNGNGTFRINQSTADINCLSITSTDASFDADVKIPFDDHKLKLGASDDLEIYHNGSHSYIQDSGTGGLVLATSQLIVNNAASNEVQMLATENGSVALYYDNSKKFETNSAGVSVIGNLAVSNTSVFSSGVTFTGANYNIAWVRSGDMLKFNDEAKLVLGTHEDIIVKHDSTNNINFWTNRAGKTFKMLHDTENQIVANSNGSIELYHNGSKKFETSSTGVTVSGSITASGGGLTTNGDVQFNSGTTNMNILFDASQQSLEFDDSVKATFGFDRDLQIYHNGSDSYVEDAGTGILVLKSDGTHVQVRAAGFDVQNAAGTETQLECDENAGVKLYYDNSEKFQTTSFGAYTTGAFHVNTNQAEITGIKHIVYGGASLYQNTGTGTGSHNGFYIGNGTSSKTAYVWNYENAEMQFATNNTTRWRILSGGDLIPHTDSTYDIGTNGTRVANIYADTLYGDGSNLTGISSVGGSTGVSFNDDVSVVLGTGNDTFIRHVAGSHTEIDHQGTGDLILETVNGGDDILLNSNDDVFIQHAGEDMAQFRNDGEVSLYYDNSKKMQTESNGLAITANHHIRIANGVWTGNHAGKIQHHDNYLWFQGGSNGFVFRSSGGINRVVISADGHFEPQANNTYDMGTSSNRWRNVFTNDLNLSNEGGANDVDGTWGDWTIQEGESNLFLKNNRSGKKYKFNLTEVS